MKLDAYMVAVTLWQSVQLQTNAMSRSGLSVGWSRLEILLQRLVFHYFELGWQLLARFLSFCPYGISRTHL